MNLPVDAFGHGGAARHDRPLYDGYILDFLDDQASFGLFLSEDECDPRFFVIRQPAGKVAIQLDASETRPAFSIVHLTDKPIARGLVFRASIWVTYGAAPSLTRPSRTRVGLYVVSKGRSGIRCAAPSGEAVMLWNQTSSLASRNLTYHQCWGIAAQGVSSLDRKLFEAPRRVIRAEPYTRLLPNSAIFTRSQPPVA